MAALDPDKRKPTIGHDSMGGPTNFRDASGSHTSQILWKEQPTVIQIPATNGQAQRPSRGNENPYSRSRNTLGTYKRRTPGNPNVRQTILAKPPDGFSLSAESRAPKRQKFDNHASSFLTSNSASSWNARESAHGSTFDFDIQEIKPPHSTNDRSNAIRNTREVIDLQTSSDDLGERIPRIAESSSPDPLWLHSSKAVPSKPTHPFDTHPTEYRVTTSSKGKSRAEESHIVVEGSEEDEDIEEFPPSSKTSPLSNARKSMAIPEHIVRDRRPRFENSSTSAPAAIRLPIEKGVNSVDLTTGRVVTKMKKKDGPKSTGISDSIGTSSSNFLNSAREKEKTQVLPLEAWCLGHHLFRHSETAPAKLIFEGAEQRIKVSWGQPLEYIEFKLKEGIRLVMIVNDSVDPLKENVLVRFTTKRTDKWTGIERKYKGFEGGADYGREMLTFLFSAKDRDFSVTSYQQFVTAIKKTFAASAVEVIGQAKGGTIWEFATRHAEMFEQTTSKRGKGDLNESIADGSSMPTRFTTPCSSTSVKTRMSYPEPPKESYRRSARQSAIGSSRASLPAQVEPDELILMYPPAGIGALSVMQSDLRRLQPEEYLNDTLIEFGLKLWHNELRDKDPALADQIHVFSSFFYKKLNNRKNPGDGYKSVRKWTSKVAFFDKKYVIVPINENLHWYLAIIYAPGYTLEPPLPVCQISNARRTRRQTQQEHSEADAEPATISEPTEVSPERSSPTAQITEGEPDAELSSADATRMTTPSTSGNEEMNDTAMRAFDKACSITAESEPASVVSSEIQIRDPSPVPDLLFPPSDGMDVDMDISGNSKVPIQHKMSDKLERSTSKSSSGIPVSQFYASMLESEVAKPVVIVDKDDSVEDRQQEAEVDDMLAVPQSSRRDLPQTYIFTLDSLGTRHPQAIKVLKEYLAAEAKDKRGFDEVRGAVGKQVQVPVQPNTWDCGVYLLHFVNVFMSAPSAFLEQILSARGTIPSSERKKMWQDHEIAQFRDNLRSRIMQLSKEWKAEKVREEEANKRRGAGVVEVEALSSEGEIDIVEDVPSVRATSGPRQKRHATRLRG